MIHTIILGHHRVEQIELCLEENLKQYSRQDVRFVVVWQHYPLPDKQNNTECFYQMIRNFDDRPLLIVDKGEPMGMQLGIARAIETAAPQRGDKIIFLDPDDRIVSYGFDDALDAVTDETPIASLCSPNNYRELCTRPVHEETIAGYHCFVPHVACQAQVSMCSWEWLEGIGGYKITEGKTYGGTEVIFWRKLLANGHKWPYLADYWLAPWERGRLVIDDAYIEWKLEHAHGGSNLDFEPWLRSKGIIA